MSQSTVQDLARQIKDLLAREPGIHVELNLLLSPIAHVLLGPGPDALHSDPAPNAVAREESTPISSRHFQSTKPQSTHDATSGQGSDQGGPRRSSRATKGTKKSWSQDVGTHDVHHSITLTSSTTTGVIDPQSQSSRSNNGPNGEASCQNHLPAHDRESAATITGKAVGRIPI